VAVEKGDFKLAWIAMVSPDGSVQPVAKAGEIAYLDGIGVLIRDDEPEGRGPVGTAIREKRPVVIENIDQDPRMAPWRKRAQQFGLHYVAAFPLTIAGKVAGSFQVYAPRAGFFDENELSLLTQVSADISFALEARINLAARNQAEVELRTSERKLRTLSQAVEQSPAIVLITSPTGEIDYVNPKFTEVTGYSLEETLGKNPRLLKSGHQSPGFYKELWETITAGREWRGELCNRKKNGEVYWEFAVIAPIKDEYGTIAHFVALNEDITERKRLEQDVIEISGHELNRIGQELHDDICQCLAGTAVLAGVLAKGIAKESPGNAAKAQEISDYTRHTLDALRMLARGLTPAVIQSEGGLAGALFKLAANVEELFHIRCRCDFTSTVDARDETAALHLYRIAQEAISNAVRHGGAHEVGILLQSHKGRISMLIRDDGCGIPQPLPQTPGMGLRTMRYRAGIIGATLEIRPGAGGGTEIVCTLPKEL
jgi:PAS domain S-box-containing protein